MINMEGFYKTFEDNFRGSRELILERLKVYLPLVKIIKDIYPDASAVDLGCGRGEWLELLNANQIDAVGVDIDNDMVNFSQSLGLKVTLNDCLSYLKTLQDNAVCIVSGFHIAEHLSFDYLYELIKESHRVLKPSGILILETPNPENIKVATLSFYLDPTHIRPIPPMLASFLFSNCGFIRTKIMRLQEDKTLFEENFAKISELMDGVSPDYSIVGQKSARNETLSLFDGFFMKEYGISQEALEQKFENRLAQSEQAQTLLSEQIHQFQKEHNISHEALEQKFENRLAQSEQAQTLLSEQVHQFQKEHNISHEALEQKFENRLAQSEQAQTLLSEQVHQFQKEHNISHEALEQKFDNRLAQSEQAQTLLSEQIHQFQKEHKISHEALEQKFENRLTQSEQAQTLLSEQIHQFQKEYKISHEALEQKFENRLAQTQKEHNISHEALEQKFDNRLAQSEQKINEIYAHTEALNKQLIDITNSRSWRITKPLRSFGKFARWFVRGTTSWLTFKPQSRPRRTLRQLLIKAKEKLNNHKRAKNLILVFFKPFPKLRERLSRVGKTHETAVSINADVIPLESTVVASNKTHPATRPISCPDELSPRAKKIYKELKNAIGKKEI